MSGVGVSCFIVLLEDMMKFETIKLLLELSDLLSVCLHAGFMAVRLPHDVVDNELEVITDIKPLDLELGGHVQEVDEGLVLHHIVGHVEV
jgi:hypothetical protein